MGINEKWKEFFAGLLEIPEEGTSPERYRVLRRNIIVLMLLITIIPMFLMAVINFYQYQTLVKNDVVAPLRVLVNKTKHSFELFTAGRLSTVRFISSAYSYDQLADEKNLHKIFKALKQEFRGFVDLGLIDSNGVQVSYAGPYDLKGKNYSDQSWFHQVRVNGVYASDVFVGYRKFPHVAIAVQHISDTGESWVVRATIDTGAFDDLIASMGLDAESDAFLINRAGVFQTDSKFYGKVLEKWDESVPPLSYEPNIIEETDSKGRDVIIAYSYFPRSEYVLVVVKPRLDVMRAWYALKSELVFLFIAGILIVFLVVFRLTSVMVGRMQESDRKRELAFREMQHSHKLSSIGRLAAGVAHEINNPMAVINEKAGLMKDLIDYTQDFPNKDKFLSQVNAIIQSVQRCRTITHRLLGFARRMEVETEILDVNEVVKETLGFLEKEALHRNIKVSVSLAPDLSRISSDRGQLQQIFLNILNNAFAAVQDGGDISLTTWERDMDTVGISINDTGSGMSEETLKHIFEPFFTTKKSGEGTGLGLSITYGLVKKLGGDVEVQSKQGQGTRFTIYLPKKPLDKAGT
jgi:two-component system, NtrC family, sensor kinase